MFSFTAMAEALGGGSDALPVQPNLKSAHDFFQGLLSDKDKGMVEVCAVIGLAHTEMQCKLRESLLSRDDVISNLKQVNSLVSKSVFLGGKSPSQDDAFLMSAMYPFFGLLMLKNQRAEYSSIDQWANACADLSPKIHLLQRERIGSQIDVFGDSGFVRGAANAANALNANAKKKKNQRQLEKENKKKPSSVDMSTTFELTAVSIDAGKDDKIAAVQTMVERLGAVNAPVLHHTAAIDMKSMPQEARDFKSPAGNFVCKNLFLKAKKPRGEGDSMLWLICVPENAIVDIKAISKHLGYNNEMRQANADVLLDALCVTAGNVTPFALVNDSACKVNIILDEKMISDAENTLWFHPLTNEATIGVPASVLLKFIGESARVPMVLSFDRSETPAAVVESLNLSHEAAQERLWTKLHAMGIVPRLEENPDLTAKRPLGHSTHNLFVKAKKPKQNYLVCVKQDREANMKAIEKKLGAKDMRLASGAKECFSHEMGCITLLSAVNNVQRDVQLVIDEQIMEMPLIRVCAGCKDPLDHSQHMVVDLTPVQLKQLYAENGVPMTLINFD